MVFIFPQRRKKAQRRHSIINSLVYFKVHPTFLPQISTSVAAIHYFNQLFKFKGFCGELV